MDGWMLDQKSSQPVAIATTMYTTAIVLLAATDGCVLLVRATAAENYIHCSIYSFGYLEIESDIGGNGKPVDSQRRSEM